MWHAPSAYRLPDLRASPGAPASGRAGGHHDQHQQHHRRRRRALPLLLLLWPRKARGSPRSLRRGNSFVFNFCVYIY